MAFNGKLTDRQIGSIKEHMRDCRDCRQVHDAERALYVMASGDSGGQLLTEGIDSRLLDVFVFNPESIAPNEEAAVVKFAKSTDGGREIVGKLRELPQNLNSLVADREMPLISAINKEIARFSTGASAVTRLWTQLWRPALALAAAAAVILAFVSQWTGPDQLLEARTKCTFGAVQRSPEPLVFETDRTPCIVDAKIFTDPEPGHEYSFTIYNAVDNAVAYPTRELNEFDARGFATASMPLDTGSYRLKLYDIEEGDTLTIEWQFLLQKSQ